MQIKSLCTYAYDELSKCVQNKLNEKIKAENYREEVGDELEGFYLQMGRKLFPNSQLDVNWEFDFDTGHAEVFYYGTFDMTDMLDFLQMQKYRAVGEFSPHEDFFSAQDYDTMKTYCRGVKCKININTDWQSDYSGSELARIFVQELKKEFKHNDKKYKEAFGEEGDVYGSEYFIRVCLLYEIANRFEKNLGNYLEDTLMVLGEYGWNFTYKPNEEYAKRYYEGVMFLNDGTPVKENW